MNAARPLGNNALVVVVKMSLFHSQGLEDVGGCPFPEARSGHSFHDFGQQRESRVGIKIFVPRIEVEVFLPPDQFQDLVFGDDIVHPPSRHFQKFPLVPQPGYVVNEVADGDSLSEIWQFRQVNADVVHMFIFAPIGHGQNSQQLIDLGQQLFDNGPIAKTDGYQGCTGQRGEFLRGDTPQVGHLGSVQEMLTSRLKIAE